MQPVSFVRLGRSGLKVSRACLGTMTFGNTDWGTDDLESRRIVDAFVDAGHNFVDTADVYNAGASEEIVGRAIAKKRDEVVLATKGYNAMGDGPNERGSSRAHLTRGLDASLRRLGTDHIDLYQLHNWDHDTPIEESMTALDGFVRSGKVRYYRLFELLCQSVGRGSVGRGPGRRDVAGQPPTPVLADLA
jgi:aryl-alcohol dehydrogenase-like predicted oxidoreductase